MAMSLAMEGFALGGVLLIPALAWAIDPHEPDRVGWRVTAAGVGGGFIVLAWPGFRLIRDRPRGDGLGPGGREHAQASVGPERRVETGHGYIATGSCPTCSSSRSCGRC